MSDIIDNDDDNSNNSIITVTSGSWAIKRKKSTENTPIKRIKNDDDNPINSLDDECNLNKVPLNGTPVDRRQFRRAGPYIIGPKLGCSPVDSIVQYLAKKENTNEFVQLKILMLSADSNDSNNVDEKIIQDERQGKMLLHTEFSLLSLLEHQDGVVHHRGLFSDMAYEEDHNHEYKQGAFYTGRICKRLILVLDCYSAHDFDNKQLINLQQYLLKGKLPEMDALKIFYEIILVVESLHKKNIIHRDLKLGNIILNKSSNKITIVNFCLGKYLLNENDLLYDQRGSPVYISPDLLSGQSYKGKPSDMWALGIVLFMMLYGQFPFYESTTSALFKKIKAAEYTVPINAEVSNDSQLLIKGLLQLKTDCRLTAAQVREKIEHIFASKPVLRLTDQCVPKIRLDTKTTVLLKVKLKLPPNDQLVPSFGKMTVSMPGHSGVKRKLGTSDNGNHTNNMPARNSTDVNNSSRSSFLLRTPYPQEYPTLIDLNLHYHVRRKNLLRSVGGIIMDNSNNSGATASVIVETQPRTAITRSRNNTNNNSSNVTQQMGNLTLRSNYDASSTIPIPPFRGTVTTTSGISSVQESTALRGPPLSYRQFFRRRNNLRPAFLQELRQIMNQSASAASALSTVTSTFRSTPSQQQQQQQQQQPQSSTQAQPILFRSLQYNQPSFLAIRQQRVPRLPVIRRPIGTELNSARISTNSTLQLVPSLSVSSSTASLTSVAVRRFFDAINETFVRGNVTTLYGQFDDFTGTITDSLAMKIAIWLLTDLHRETIVQNIFRKSLLNCTNKVIDLFSRCGIQMQITDGIAIVNREQPMNLIIILSYILQAAGYNNNYFIMTEVT